MRKKGVGTEGGLSSTFFFFGCFYIYKTKIIGFSFFEGKTKIIAKTISDNNC